jgi:transcriptional regulator with XRE-family HTH domain
LKEAASKETLGQNQDALGPFLIRERAKRGLSLEDIAEKTKIRLDILDAIEKEQWDKLPPQPYVKGFLKSYCGALGIEPQEIIAIYDGKGQVGVALKPIAKPTRSGRFFYIFVVPALLGLSMIGYMTWPSLWEAANRTVIPLFSRQEPPSEMPSKEADIPQVWQRQPLQEEAVLEKTLPVNEEINEEQKEAGATGSQPEKELSGPVADPNVARFILKASAHKRTWIRVTCDGKESVELMLGAGAEKEFRAMEGFELLIGNAGGITLELNGEKLDNLGAPGEVLRMRLPDDKGKRGDKRQGE